MREVIADTSPIQYLFQLDLLELEHLGFRLSPAARHALLSLAGESESRGL